MKTKIKEDNKSITVQQFFKYSLEISFMMFLEYSILFKESIPLTIMKFLP